MKEYYSGVFLVAVDYLRLELPNIAEVAVYLATQYVQTTTNIVRYGSASLQRTSAFAGKAGLNGAIPTNSTSSADHQPHPSCPDHSRNPGCSHRIFMSQLRCQTDRTPMTMTMKNEAGQTFRLKEIKI